MAEAVPHTVALHSYLLRFGAPVVRAPSALHDQHHATSSLTPRRPDVPTIDNLQLRNHTVLRSRYQQLKHETTIQFGLE